MKVLTLDQLVENIENVTDFSRIRQEYDFILGYHGTTHRLLASIRKNGLVPREESDMHGLDHSGNSVEGRVYFSSIEKGDTFCLDRADVAVDIAGGKPIVLECLLSPEKLAPDEDTGGDIITSLKTGKIAHKGKIHPERMEEESVIKGVKWIGKGSDGYEIHENREKVKSRPPKKVVERIMEMRKKVKSEKGSEKADQFFEKKMKEYGEEYDSQMSIEEFERLLKKYQENH